MLISIRHKFLGQSGDDYHQSSIHQNVVNHGPIPEGTYWADQNQRQSISLLDVVAGTLTPILDEVNITS